MTLNLSTWSIHNPVPVILLFVLLTFAGLMAFAGMKVQNFPDIDLPTVTVAASWPGASPVQVETEVARRIENALATVQGVKHIRSHVSDGQASITVEFVLDKPVQLAVDDVRDAVARVRGDLPPELRDPVIRKAELAGGPILTYAIASTRMDLEGLSWFVDDTVTRALLAVPGVGSVARVGGASREVRVELDPGRLLALRTTAADISRQLRAVQQEASGGRTGFGGAEQSVRTIATVRTAAQIGAIELALADGRRIRLDDVASVSDTVAEPRAAAFLDGAPSVGFEIVRARGAGELEVAAGVRAALDGLRERHPGVKITEAFSLIDQVEESYASSLRMLVEGALLAVLVVFAFLRDWRATAVAAVALPLSVIPTFALMQAMGFTLNIVTLLSLSLVVGVLVDDAIVEVENIERHLSMGKPPLQAAIDASREIGLAVVATTFTLIAVFLPTAFMGGTAGKFFVQFGWTAAGAVFFSLVVARLLTPMMAARLLRAPASTARREPAWMPRYLAWAGWCLRHRRATLGGVAALVAAGIGLAAILPATFIPADDDAQTQVTLTMPPGTELGATVAMAERARLALAQHRHLRQVYAAIGGGSSGDGGPSDASAAAMADVRTARLTLTLTPRPMRDGLRKQQIERELRALLADLPGVRVQVGAGGSEVYTLVLSGEDGAALARHAPLVERDLRTLDGIGAVVSSVSLLRPELVVTPDFARAADLGVTSNGIAETLRIATVGDYQEHLAKLNLEQRQVPVLVRLGEAARADLDTLKRLPVPGARGPVALEHVATLEHGSGPVEIARLDRRRHIGFDIQLDGLAMGDVEQALLVLPSLRQLPPGIERTAAGDAEEMGELAIGFGLAMLTGVLCIYMVLVLLLRGFMQPLTILAALALSVPGAFLALYVTGAALSMPSMIGLVMLMGIATKNSILLVDYIVIAREEYGLGRSEAILDACRKRARPIVMTTIAMGAGMLPVALGWLGDPSFRAPMAIVVIGGLLTSTFLSLLVIPVVYSVVDDLVRSVTRATVQGCIA
ncbi:efflux RND transporter permease subunit [Telluria beijingensis]|uniref:efflux RND transporter permease subunit n=1 Tax=Telluria beijingensis TaxID=3068633 RepID=UPI002795AFF9|nr:efflux RND transporter permease subunit [Massilia sp. REN29]